jgi:hypothetical protein
MLLGSPKSGGEATNNPARLVKEKEHPNSYAKHPIDHCGIG